MANTINIPKGLKQVTARLRIGGDLPYKWAFYEYPKTASGYGAPEKPIKEGKLTATSELPNSTEAERKFVWSVVAVNLDESEQTVAVAGEVLSQGKVIGSVKAKWTVPVKTGTCSVHFTLKQGG